MELEEYKKIAREIADDIDLLLMPEEDEDADSLGYACIFPKAGNLEVEVRRSYYFKDEREWQIRISFLGNDHAFIFIRRYSPPTEEELEMDYAERIDNTQYYSDVLNLLTNFKVK
jgi:hypothetical protein